MENNQEKYEISELSAYNVYSLLHSLITNIKEVNNKILEIRDKETEENQGSNLQEIRPNPSLDKIISDMNKERHGIDMKQTIYSPDLFKRFKFLEDASHSERKEINDMVNTLQVKRGERITWPYNAFTTHPILNIVDELYLIFIRITEQYNSKIHGYAIERLKKVEENEKSNKAFLNEIRQEYNKKIDELDQIRLKEIKVIEDKKISELKRYYEDRIDIKNTEYKQNRCGYWITLIIQVVIIVFLTVDIAEAHFLFKQNEKNISPESIVKIMNNIPPLYGIEALKIYKEVNARNERAANNYILYILLFSLLGIDVFLFSDFRKKMNISKTILDDIEQKKIILDSIPVLIARNQEFKEVDGVEYEKQILNALINAALIPQNYGYSNKDMQNSSPNMLIDLIHRFTGK